MEIWPSEVDMKEWESQLMAVWNLLLALQWRIEGRGPGGSTPLPLFSDQIEARRAEIFFFFETGPPPFSQGVDDSPTPHLPIWRSATALLMFVFKKHCI